VSYCKNRHCFYNRSSCVRLSCFAINVLIYIVITNMCAALME
jgi:hypothetical protein